MLSPLAKKLPGARVLLFVKERRLAFYTHKYRKVGRPPPRTYAPFYTHKYRKVGRPPPRTYAPR